ncbi:uncharacterized protein Pyn_05038 [Prunus yedoensis var. nudiflora]|uniref:GRF-type domain-containing protein n=1 Tax=Prunus yedoensis var. nudiflora TaxID=2094558 RepID=A0A314YZR9_PRUYE|nr:uncharacterized protein Pyn_05038 [Prunus yedoensis var. nudiflora]
MRKEPPGGEELAIAAPHCYCGRLARLQTSWTESNPLRRFFRGKSSCGFFVWVDIEMPRRERALMAWLLRTKREVEDQIVRARAREKKLWIALFMSWAFVFMLNGKLGR